jgi:hypothetical protein
MPDIVGSAQEPGDDEEMTFEPSQSLAGPSFLQQVSKKDTEPPGPPSAAKFIAPASFYGAPPPKPKPKGPLCVLMFPSCEPTSYIRPFFLDMMLQLLMQWS